MSTSSLLAAALGAATVFTLALGVWAIVDRDRDASRRDRRLRTFVREATVAGPVAPGGALRRALLGPLAAIGERAAVVLPERRLAALQERLRLAGQPAGLDVRELLGLSIALAVAGLAGGLALGAGADATTAAAVGIGGALAGYLAPGLWLRWLARSRRRIVLRVLPSAIDILAVSMEAGLTFDGAVAHLARRWHNPLGEEFGRLFVELQMGRPRRQSLREFAARIGLEEVRHLVAAVIQGEVMGAPLARTLRDQAEELRILRRQRAEAAARVAPIKMTFPMVLLVFPALFIVLLGPAIPRLLDLFGAR